MLRWEVGMPKPRDLVTSTAIAAMAGSTNTSYAIEQCRRKATFPRPVPRSRAANGAILWYKDEVEVWIRENPIDPRYKVRFDAYSSDIDRDELIEAINKLARQTIVTIAMHRLTTKDVPFKMCSAAPYESPYYRSLVPETRKAVQIRDSGWY
jgi:hypothetical protein